MPQILIIDDDPTIRLTLQKVLSTQGYEVAMAKDGEEGLNKAKELHPSLIICDWMMPLMDGLEVCNRIKSNIELSNIYLILLTARDQEGDLVRGLEMGADDFLSKPPRINELRARVRAGLGYIKPLKNSKGKSKSSNKNYFRLRNMCNQFYPNQLKATSQFNLAFCHQRSLVVIVSIISGSIAIISHFIY